MQAPNMGTPNLIRERCPYLERAWCPYYENYSTVTWWRCGRKLLQKKPMLWLVCHVQLTFLIY